MSDHEGREGCLERTSFPLFHPKKSKILSRTGSGNERARKLDRYGGTNIEELEDEGFRRREKEYQTGQVTFSNASSSNIGLRLPVPDMASAAQLMGQGSPVNSGSTINQYMLNPFLAMGIQLPQLAFLMQQQQLQRQQLQQREQQIYQLAQPSVHQPVPSSTVAHLSGSDQVQDISVSRADHSKTWHQNIPAFPHIRDNLPVPSAVNTAVTSVGTSNLVTSHAHTVMQVPKENQIVQPHKDDSGSSNNSNINKQPFVCDLCRQWFFAKEKLIMHLVMNHNMHYCRYCSEIFEVAEMRDVHIIRSHLPLLCDMCESHLPSSEALSEHYLNSHDVQSCLYCGVLVRPKSYYSTHAKKKHFISNKDMLESDAKIRIFQNWGTEIGSGGSVWNFTCNLCGKERKRSETFGHFFSYHRVSLSCLMQLLAGEGVSISVQGTPPTASSLQTVTDEAQVPVKSDSSAISGNQKTVSDDTRTSSIYCVVCANQFTQQVPKTAHDLFCRGLSVCRVCEQPFTSVMLRSAHMLTEHGKLPCRIGCPADSKSFSQEAELSAHYWHEHKIFVCSYCKSLVAADRQLFAEHLKREHHCLPDCPALQGSGFGSELFQCRASNMSFFVYCSLCDSDITTIMKDINLLFQHLQQHKISVPAALDLLENRLMFGTNSVLLSDDKLGVQSMKDDDEMENEDVETNSSKFNIVENNENFGTVVNNEKCTVDASASSSDISKLRLIDSNNDEIVPETIENIASTSNSVCTAAYPKEKKDPSRSKHLKTGIGLLEEKDEENSRLTKGSDDIMDDSSSESPTSDEEFGISEADAVDNDYSEEDESTATEEFKPGGSNRRTTSDLGEADFDPHDVECVFTDTSDDECDDTELSLNISVKSEQQEAREEEVNQEHNSDLETENAGSDSVQVKEEQKAQDDEVRGEKGECKLIPSRTELCCEICQGCFIMEDGPRELARHMNVAHGFSVSSYGVRQFTCNINQCGETFGTDMALDHHQARLHEGSRTNSTSVTPTEHCCPFCAIRSRTKSALRQHIFLTHSEEIAHESPPHNLRYQCRHCNVTFWRLDERNDHHVLKHEDQIENFYKCCLCQRVYASKLCLNRHMRLDHANEHSYSALAYKCRLCLILVPSTSMLRPHFQEFHPSSLVFYCHRCNTTLKTKKTLKCHIKNVHSEERRRDCGLCGKVLWSKRAYAIHFRMKHSAQSKVGFRCRICQQRFDSKDERKLHYQVDHSGESPYHCAECGKGFASKSGMYGHRQLHTGSGISKCEYCGKEFTRKDSYNEHLLIHNGPRHKCPHCPKEFVQRSNLVRHIRIHTGEKPYKCLYCEKCFSDKGACNSHIRVHTREETCSCPYCGQTFSKKQKLKYHIRKHTGEGLMTCEICNKTFTNSFALKEHRIIHNRQTQILCQQCGKGFNSEKYLQRHVAIVHEPTKLFACPLCPKVFSQHGRLKAHLMTHTGVKHMKCLLCEKAYSVRKSLRRHLLEKHQVSPEHPQYKNCFYAMSAAEAGLLIPEGAGPFVPPDDDSTSQSKEEDDYRPKKPPPRKFPRKPPGRKGLGRRGVSKGSAAFEVYGSQDGDAVQGEGAEVKKPRRKYNTKKRQREAAEAAAAAAAAAAAQGGSATATGSSADPTASGTANPVSLNAHPPSPASSADGPARRTRQKSSPKTSSVPISFLLDSSSSADEAPCSPPPVKRKVGRPPKRQQQMVTQMKKLQLAGKKKRRVEAIVEILQKTSNSPSSASPREDDEEKTSKSAEMKPENIIKNEPVSDDGPVLAKILPLNYPKTERKGPLESQPEISGRRTRCLSVDASKNMSDEEST